MKRIYFPKRRSHNWPEIALTKSLRDFNFPNRFCMKILHFWRWSHKMENSVQEKPIKMPFSWWKFILLQSWPFKISVKKFLLNLLSFFKKKSNRKSSFSFNPFNAFISLFRQDGKLKILKSEIKSYLIWFLMYKFVKERHYPYVQFWVV